jgi:diguanylate cyclase (GGDEF)-like protein/PAS domain S-box-containing protein
MLQREAPGRRLFPQGLRTRLLVATLLIVGPVLLIGLLALVSFSSDLLRRAAESDITADARSTALSIAQIDQDTVWALQNLATLPEIISMDPDRQRPVLMHAQKLHARIDILRATALDGVSRARTDGDSPVDYSDREWFKKCIGGQEAARQTIITKTGNRPSINTSVPIRDADGKIVGVLSAVTNLAAFTDLVGVLSRDANRFTLLVDESGKALSHPSVRELAELKDFSAEPAVKFALTAKNGNFEFTAGGDSWLSYSQSVGNGWIVVSQTNLSRMPAPGITLHRIAAVLALACVVIVGLLTWLIGGRVLRPIHQLNLATSHLGAGNWSYRVSEKAAGEVGQLAKRFNQMAQQLEAVYRGIENEIKQRTASLQAANDQLAMEQSAVRRLSRAVEQTPASIMITDCQAQIVFVNQSFCKRTGFTETEVLGRHARMLKSDRMSEEMYQDIWTTINAGREWRGEIPNRHKDGTPFWELAVISPLLDETGAITNFLSVKEDITVHKAMEDELRRAARVDKLTNLPNRAVLLERLQQAIIRRRRNPDNSYAVLYLDFDRFKIVNDSLGHEVGDELLRRIATRLQRALRETDLVSRPEDSAARLGGDEFVVLLEGDLTPETASATTQRLLDALAEPYLIGPYRIVSTASFGVVVGSSEYERAEDVLRDADTAMYEAKLAGKGRHVLFDEAMRRRVQRRMHLESELRCAIERNELFLHYQPIVSLDSGKIEGVESLVRWQHPEFGLIPPGEFIPIAEECALIEEIGEWVMRQACRQLAQWRRMPQCPVPSVSVNLSRQQLLVPDIVDKLTAIAREEGVPTEFIHLEITESTVMRDAKTASAILRDLKSHGFKLDMDDFGTGHSSLSTLHQFPFDILKIDRSFIINLSRGRDYAALVSAITLLARNLGIKVVAEGVETAEQMLLVQALDCHYSQGYYFGRPMPAAEISAYQPPASLLSGTAKPLSC